MCRLIVVPSGNDRVLLWKLWAAGLVMMGIIIRYNSIVCLVHLTVQHVWIIYIVGFCYILWIYLKVLLVMSSFMSMAEVNHG